MVRPAQESAFYIEDIYEGPVPAAAVQAARIVVLSSSMASGKVRFGQVSYFSPTGQPTHVGYSGDGDVEFFSAYLDAVEHLREDVGCDWDEITNHQTPSSRVKEIAQDGFAEAEQLFQSAEAGTVAE